MPYFKDKQGKVHYLSVSDMAAGGQNYLPAGVVPISDSDAAAIINPPPTLAQVKEERTAAIDAACAAAVVSGFKSSALGSAYTYPSSQTDQANLSANVLSSLLPGLPANWQTPQMCADAAGSWAYRLHTAAQIQQVGSDGKQTIIVNLVKNATLQAQIAAAATVAAVQAVVW